MEKLREDMLAAIGRSSTLEELLDIIRRHKSSGVSQRDAYNTLESLWVELGCQGSDDETAPCALLGAVMDRVWGHCSRSQSLWDTALSS